MNKKKMEKEIYSFNEILLKKGKKVCTLNNGYICNSKKADEIIRMFYKMERKTHPSAMLWVGSSQTILYSHQMVTIPFKMKELYNVKIIFNYEYRKYYQRSY